MACQVQILSWSWSSTERDLQSTLLQANRVVHKRDSWPVIIAVASATGPIAPGLACLPLVHSGLEVPYFVHDVLELLEFARANCSKTFRCFDGGASSSHESTLCTRSFRKGYSTCDTTWPDCRWSLKPWSFGFLGGVVAFGGVLDG